MEEVLTEQITLMLGSKEGPEPPHSPGPEPVLEKKVPAIEQEVLVLPPVHDQVELLVSTPAPSPPASPAPSSRDSPALATPLLSEPSRSLTEESELAEGQTSNHVVNIKLFYCFPVATDIILFIFYYELIR